MIFDGHVELDRFEEIARGGAREDGQPVGRGPPFFVKPREDAVHIVMEALPLGRARRPRPAVRGELLPDEQPVSLAAMLIGAAVEVETDHRSRGRGEIGQAIDQTVELHDSLVKLARRLEKVCR